MSPKTALSVGLKVDVDALPPSVIDALKAGHLDDPSVTVQLLKLNAVVGVMGKVVGANDNLATVGITCALCAEWSESRGGETRRGSVHGRGGLCGVSYAAAVYGVASGPDPSVPVLHETSEIPTNDDYAERSATKKWRTTPLRASRSA